jgi:hypothetical protein
MPCMAIRTPGLRMERRSRNEQLIWTRVSEASSNRIEGADRSTSQAVRSRGRLAQE